MYKTYAMTFGAVTDDVVKEATYLFFTIGAIPGLIYASISTTRTALNPAVDSAVRNQVAIGSLGGYALAAWRVTFPFVLFGGDGKALGYEFSLSTVLLAVGGVYAVFVIVPLLLGARLYREERRAVIEESGKLLARVEALEDPKLSGTTFQDQRVQLSERVNQMLVDLYENDALLKFLAFWRWGPDLWFAKGEKYWTLREEKAAGDPNPLFPQRDSVMQRPWFQRLIDKEGRVRRYPQLEMQATPFLQRIPNWNYRAAIFDELVPVLEDLQGNDPKSACSQARLARKRVAEFEHQRPGRSIPTAFFISLFSAVGPYAIKHFEGEIMRSLQLVLRLIKV
jgi:hypothetical protein